MRDPRDVIKRPVITERTTDLLASKKYVFEVDLRANKTEIKDAVQTIFGVKVVNVNTMRVKGKPKRVGKYFGRRSDWKKAIVELSEDSKTIEYFESM